MRRFRQRGIAVTGKRDSFRSLLARIFDCCDGERSTSAGGNADYDIVLSGIASRDLTPAELSGVFICLDRRSERLDPTSHDELNHFRIGIESRRTLSRVERGDTPAASGADVD